LAWFGIHFCDRVSAIETAFANLDISPRKSSSQQSTSSHRDHNSLITIPFLQSNRPRQSDLKVRIPQGLISSTDILEAEQFREVKADIEEILTSQRVLKKIQDDLRAEIEGEELSPEDEEDDNATFTFLESMALANKYLEESITQQIEGDFSSNLTSDMEGVYSALSPMDWINSLDMTSLLPQGRGEIALFGNDNDLGDIFGYGTSYDSSLWDATTTLGIESIASFGGDLLGCDGSTTAGSTWVWNMADDQENSVSLLLTQPEDELKLMEDIRTMHFD
jgi:hypothetical protein